MFVQGRSMIQGQDRTEV